MRWFVVVLLAVACGRTADGGRAASGGEAGGGGAKMNGGAAAHSGAGVSGGAGVGVGSAGSTGNVEMPNEGGVGGAGTAGTGAGTAGTGAGGESAGGTAPGPCAGVGTLELRDFQVLEDDGDGLYEPGESFRVVANLVSNGGPATAKLSLSVDDPSVIIEGGVEVGTFALEAEQSQPVSVTVEVPLQLGLGSELGFALTLTNPEAPECFAPLRDERVIILARYPEDVMICDAVRQFVIADPEVVALGGDDKVQPGEDFDLKVMLSNPGPVDLIGPYPGISIESNHAGVQQRDLGGWWFAIGPWSIAQTWGMHVGSTVASGTQVSLKLSGAALHVRCRDVDAVDFSFLVE